MNTYGQSTSLLLSFRLSSTFPLPPPFPQPVLVLLSALLVVRFLSRSSSSTALHSRPSSLQPPLSRLREPSVRQPLGVPPPRDEEASLQQQQQQQRQQERPSRNGAALCPEFVPRRSSCSFTRGDKSGASLSHTLSLVLYLVCVFLCREPTTLSCTGATPRYTDLTASSLSAFLPRGRLSTCYRVCPRVLRVSENYRNGAWRRERERERERERDEPRRLPVSTRVSERRNNTYACVRVALPREMYRGPNKFFG